MKSPKIIILLMSCNDSMFLHQEEIIRLTWINNIKQYKNINYFFYRSGNTTYIDKKNHIIYTNTKDDLDATYLKTVEAFKEIDNNFNYDYIVRTNCTTYINISLLDYFLTELYKRNDNRIICGDLCYYINSITVRGNSLILPKTYIKEIIEFDYNTYDLEHQLYGLKNTHDDIVISYIFNRKYEFDNIQNFIKNGKKYIIFYPCIYFNDVFRKSHLFGKFDKYYQKIYTDITDKNKLKNDDLQTSIFISYRKNLETRYNELGECINIYDMLLNTTVDYSNNKYINNILNNKEEVYVWYSYLSNNRLYSKWCTLA